MKKLGFLVSFFLSAGCLLNEASAVVTIPFTITLSEAATVTGTPRVAVDVGGVTRYATYSAGSGTNTLTFTLSPQAGDLDLDGIAVSSPIDLNGGTIKDLAGNDLSPLTFTPPNTSGIKIDYPSLGMDFVYDADGRYTLNGTVYNDLTGFLSAAGGTFTRASIGTYFDSSGILQTAASGVPRFDWDPVTHAAKGILIEGSRSNLLIQSSNMQTWVIGSNTTFSGLGLAPDGTNTAVQLTGNGSGSNEYIDKTLALSANTTYTVSVYAKLSAGTVPTVGKIISAVYNDGTGTVRANVMMNGNLTSTWKRFSATFLNVTASTGYMYFIADQNNTATIDVWGAQLEVGSFPTSYIPTTNAAVTRATDLFNLSTAGWYSSTQGTLYTQAVYDSLGGSSSRGVLYLDDTSPNNAVGLYLEEGVTPKKMGYQVVYGNTWQAGSYSAAYTAGSVVKGALAYQDNDANAAFNGTLVGADNSLTLSPYSRLIIGNMRGNWGAMTGHVSSARYYSRRVPDAQLQLLTQ